MILIEVMLMQRKKKYLSYLRYYRDEELHPDFSWWYCIADSKIYETTELYSLFKYSSKDEIYASSCFIEFPKVDIIELKKTFIADQNKAFIFKDNNDKKFDLEFNKYIEINHITQNWYEYEIDVLNSVFNEWCISNNIFLEQL